MALQPNIPFSDGDNWTPDLAYGAFNSPVFDDQPQYLGHRLRIVDDELSNIAGQIKDRVSFLENSLKVVVESGLTVRYSSGTVLMTDNTVRVVSSGLIGVGNNTTTYIMVDVDGVVKSALRLPLQCVPLASVSTSNGTITQIQDYRHPNQRRIQAPPNAIKVFGGISSVSKTTYSNEVLGDSLYYFRDFTVPAGTTCFIPGFAKIYCSGSVSIQGTIVCLPLNTGAPIATYSLVGGYYVGDQAGSGLGSKGLTYPWSCAPYGSGGSGGLLQCKDAGYSWAYSGRGGDGGGGIWLEAAGSIAVFPGAQILAKGTFGRQGGNYYNGTESGYTNNMTFAVSGSGGGSGGLVMLSSLQSITAYAGSQIDVSGGYGANGIGVSLDGARPAAIGGGGGGGGYVVMQSPNNTMTGSSIELSGGNCGQSQAIMIYEHPNYISQVSPQVSRIENPLFVLSGGKGGGYGGGSLPPIITTATESGLPIVYSQQRVASPGRLIVQNYTPIGS